MIVEKIVDMFFGLVMFVLNLLPDGNISSWIGDGTYLSQIWGMGAGLGAWVPWSLFGQMSAMVIGAVVAGFSIKVVRLVASYFTAGGGSAG